MEDFPEKSAGRAAINSDLVDISGAIGGAEVVREAVGANVVGGAVGVVLGLEVQGLVTRGTMGLGLIGVLEGSAETLVDSLRGLLWILGVEAQGGESILMSEGLSLPNARENSPFRLLVLAKIGSYT